MKSNDINTYLPKLNKNQLILVLTQLGINTEGKPDVICNKRNLMRWIQKGYEDMGDKERDLEGKFKQLQDLFTLITSFTDSNGEHHKDVEQHDQGGTPQQQNKTMTTPFNAEPTGTEQHQSTLNGKKTAEQVYVGPT